MARVMVVLGSASDIEAMTACTTQLETLGIDYELHVASAHRTPDRVRELASGAAARGVRVIIAAASGAAALPGAIKAYSPLPVVGVPLASSALGGWDALLSIAQMPPGMPVAAVAVGDWGARNAALLAVEVLALQDPTVSDAYVRFRREQTERTLGSSPARDSTPSP